MFHESPQKCHLVSVVAFTTVCFSLPGKTLHVFVVAFIIVRFSLAWQNAALRLSRVAQAMSCPPPAFLSKEFLSNARGALGSSGMLVINCVSRSKAAVDTAIAAIQDVFREVRMQEMEDDVNCILFALCAASESAANSAAKNVGAQDFSWVEADTTVQAELRDMLASLRVA